MGEAFPMKFRNFYSKFRISSWTEKAANFLAIAAGISALESGGITLVWGGGG